MKTRILFTLVLLTSFLFTLDAQRFCYVDINSILESSSEYKKAQDDLDRIASQWRSEIAKEYDEIKGLYNKYQAEQVLMSEDVRQEREQEILAREKQVRDMQKDKFGPEGTLFRKRQELVRPIQDKVYASIEAFARDKGYDFVFDKGGAAGIIFSDASYDKTEDIIDALRE